MKAKNCICHLHYQSVTLRGLGEDSARADDIGSRDPMQAPQGCPFRVTEAGARWASKEIITGFAQMLWFVRPCHIKVTNDYSELR